MGEAAEQLDRVFSALADPTRRDIVTRLGDHGASSVGEIAKLYPISLQAVSKHLRVLEDAGLVSRGREGQRRPVHLEAEVLDLMTAWIERFRHRREEQYRRLDAVLEAQHRGEPDDVQKERTPGAARESDDVAGRNARRPDEEESP